MPDTVAIIQGRMGSSRLPGKVLRDIGGKPMLQHVIERVSLAKTLQLVMTATSTDSADEPIADYCAANGIPCYRGSLHDVLDRFYQASKWQNARTIVRITADCPLIDPVLIDQAVQLVTNSDSSHNFDFTANRLPPPYHRTFPIGLDVEVCTFAALERAWRESKETFHREHVMPYLYEGVELAAKAGNISTGTSLRGFRIGMTNHTSDHGSQRWTVDTPEDLLFIEQIYQRLVINQLAGPGIKPCFSWLDVLSIVEKEPELAMINSQVRHKTMTEVDERAIK
ncbi:MAG: glycosyltransferase family protein [Chloroflexota bacterium]